MKKIGGRCREEDDGKRKHSPLSPTCVIPRLVWKARWFPRCSSDKGVRKALEDSSWSGRNTRRLHALVARWQRSCSAFPPNPPLRTCPSWATPPSLRFVEIGGNARRTLCVRKSMRSLASSRLVWRNAQAFWRTRTLRRSCCSAGQPQSEPKVRRVEKDERRSGQEKATNKHEDARLYRGNNASTNAAFLSFIKTRIIFGNLCRTSFQAKMPKEGAVTGRQLSAGLLSYNRLWQNEN